MVVTMSEFGRTARENGNRGTDHGHANVMFVLGGAVRGGRVYGRWPGLDPSQLNDGRDLALTTDFRTVLGEAVHVISETRILVRSFLGSTTRRSDCVISGDSSGRIRHWRLNRIRIVPIIQSF